MVGNQKKCANCKSKRAAPKRKLKTVECVHCGKPFSTDIYNRKFCSKRCRELYHYNPESKEHICPVCGKSFMTPKGNRKYCSDACAHKAKLNPLWRTLNDR